MSYEDFSCTHSMDGKMLAVVYSDSDRFWKDRKTFIATHDLIKPTTHLHHISEAHLISPIWTHGEFLQFATMKSGCITVWKGDFTLKHTPDVVWFLSASDEIVNLKIPKKSLFLPTHSRLAIPLKDTLLVWDAQHSKLLLKFSLAYPSVVSFSSNGCFFACMSLGGEVYVWKESPAGYILHQKLAFRSMVTTGVYLSPNGESIIVALGPTIHLLHTKDPTFSCLDANQDCFILRFSPSRTLVAFTQRQKNTIRVLNLQSGEQWLVIDTDVEVYDLKVDESVIIVVGRKTDNACGTTVKELKVNNENSIHVATTFKDVSQSPTTIFGRVSPDGWQSSCGYEVTNDGWILSGSKQRLLWLPHHWRSRKQHRRWEGQFLGLLHEELAEVVILEFLD